MSLNTSSDSTSRFSFNSQSIKRVLCEHTTRQRKGHTFGVQTDHPPPPFNLNLNPILPQPHPEPPFYMESSSERPVSRPVSCRMGSVHSSSFHTPCIQTNDLLQDTNDLLQDREDPFDDLISYPSTSDDLRALSHSLRENLQATA